jgi:hypothetical protein
MPGGQFGDGALHQSADDPVTDAMERILDVALAELDAPFIRRPADRQLERAVDDLDDLGHADRVRTPRQLIPAVDALLRPKHAALHEALKHLRHQLQGHVVPLGDLPRAGGFFRRRDERERNQRVVGLLGQPEHGVWTPEELRPLQSYFRALGALRQAKLFGWNNET